MYVPNDSEQKRPPRIDITLPRLLPCRTPSQHDENRQLFATWSWLHRHRSFNEIYSYSTDQYFLKFSGRQGAPNNATIVER